MPSPAEILVRDAADTLGRMRDDARHLRELAARGKVAVTIAGRATKAKIDATIEATLERVADGILDLERVFQASASTRRRAERGRR